MNKKMERAFVWFCSDVVFMRIIVIFSVFFISFRFTVKIVGIFFLLFSLSFALVFSFQTLIDMQFNFHTFPWDT